MLCTRRAREVARRIFLGRHHHHPRSATTAIVCPQLSCLLAFQHSPSVLGRKDIDLRLLSTSTATGATIMSEAIKRKSPTRNRGETSYSTAAADDPKTAVPETEEQSTDTQHHDNSSQSDQSSKSKERARTNPRKKHKKDIAKNLTRRMPCANDQTPGDNCLPQQPHAGSYANPEMQKLFQVELPRDYLDGSKNEIAAATLSVPQPIKRSKKKVAFLLGYLGTNYGGFQINPAQRTLQATLELALLKCHFLDIRNFGFPNKYGFSTSGRTDKGVHAAAQVCSAKIEMLPDQSLDDVRLLLNEALPSDIRVLDVVRTTRNFCAKTQRDRVRYQYMIPSFILADIATIQRVFEKWGAPNNGSHPTDRLSRTELEKIQKDFCNYRVTPSQLQSLRTALGMYEGTHSFHNFTKGVSPKDARATRYIVSFHVEDPVVFDNGTEWVPTQVLGQSFLLHQIRKMICMAIEVVRGAATMETLELAMSKDNCSIQVGLAPAQGLYLDMSYYTGYNRRKQRNAELHDIEWEREDLPAHARWKEFRNGCVMKHVVDEEEREGNFVKFLFLQEYMYDRDRAYDPTKEKIHNQWRLLDSSAERMDSGES